LAMLERTSTASRYPAALVACVALCCAPVSAYVDASKSFPAIYVEKPPEFDLNAPAWAGAPLLDGFETVTTRTPAKLPTTARIVFDATNVYVAIHCVQTNTPITATQTTNNVGFGIDDFAGVGIDTSGNGQAYYFEVTPAGVRYQQATESARYSPQWVAQTKRIDDGWDALLIVPLNVLRASNGAVQRWRFNLIRHIAAVNENETWAYDPIMTDSPNNGGFPQLTDARFWPYVDGIKIAGNSARPKPRAELFALDSVGGNRNVYQQATGVFAPEGTRNYGLDVNVPLLGSIAYVGAFAPDFSNVEIDQQTIAPQEFRRNLTEYRPFFAQGANFFNPVSLVGINQAPNLIWYSPGIGPFEQGHKIEGSYGLQQIGLIDVNGAGFNDSVLAFKHILSDHTFSYSFDAVSAHHADGNSTAYPFADNDVTWDATVAGRNLHNGFVYALDYGAERGSNVPGTTSRLAYKTEDFVDVHKGNYEVFVGYRGVGPMWNPIDGFTNLADLNGPMSYVDFNGNPKRGIFKRVEFFATADRFVDRSGATHEVDFGANLDFQFRNQLHLNFGPGYSAVRFYENGLAPVGYGVGYAGGVTVPFYGHNVTLGYKDGTPTPIDFYTQWGPFTTFNADGTVRPTYLSLYTLTTSRPIGRRLSLGLEYDGTLETFPTSNPSLTTRDGQNLRRISLTDSLGDEASFSLSLRSISGTGGFASPGLNLAAAYHQRFRNNSEVFVNYGTPAANATIQRWIVKYLVRIGSGAGT
jgi:hypothetical protein